MCLLGVFPSCRIQLYFKIGVHVLFVVFLMCVFRVFCYLRWLVSITLPETSN